jgi:serine beta-lactamase-like protein LACTB
MAAVKLASRGILDLDAPISKWLPDLPVAHRLTTMRQLLTHRGGVRHFDKSEIDIANRTGAIYMRVYSNAKDVLSLFIDDPLIATPGTSVNYSSYGYTLASTVMAAAGARPFTQLVDEEVGKPLSLSSLAVDDPWSVIKFRANKYMNAADIELLCGGLSAEARPKLTDGWANMPFSNPGYCLAGAGYIMTPSDAARFGSAMVGPGNTKLTITERKMLFTPQTEATPKSPALGLGWRIDRDKRGRNRWHHAGATPGGCYFLGVYPDEELSVALAGNVMAMRMNVAQAGADLIDLFV